MTEPSNPYDSGGGNPYGGGGSVVPMSTKPRQEPAGSRPADPQDAMVSQTLQMQQEQATKTPEVTINQAPPPAQNGPGTAPAGPGGAAPESGPPATPGAMAAREDEMVRYVLTFNPGLSVLSARTIVRMAEDLSAPTELAPQVIPTMNFGEMAHGTARNVEDSFNDIRLRQHQQQQQVQKGVPIHPMDRVNKNPLKQFLKDKGQQVLNNPTRDKSREQIRKDWLNASPEDHARRITEDFADRVRGLHPSHPDFAQAHAEMKAAVDHQQQRVTDAFNKHVSEAYQLHRSLKESGSITKKDPNWDTRYFYRNTYALHHPHKWQHMFPGGLPSYSKAQAWQRAQAGNP